MLILGSLIVNLMSTSLFSFIGGNIPMIVGESIVV